MSNIGCKEGMDVEKGELCKGLRNHRKGRLPTGLSQTPCSSTLNPTLIHFRVLCLHRLSVFSLHKLAPKHRMASAAIDWSHRIIECTDKRFKILPDIVFKIVDQGVIHHVKAHKMILGMVSPKICMMLNREVNQDKVKVAEEETKKVSFKVVIDAIYNIKSVKESLENRTVEHIFSVVNLAARCHLPELLAAALHCLPPAYLSPAALLEVALESVRSNLPLSFSPQVRIYSEFTSSEESEKKTPSLTPAIVTVLSDESDN